MAKKKITVRTVKAKAKVEIQPDASGAPQTPGLSMAASNAAPQGQGGVPDRLQNPFENGGAAAPIATKPENYTWQAILMLLATMMVLAIIGIQYFEWDLYTGGFTPVFLKTQPGMMAVPRNLPPVTVDETYDAPEETTEDLAEDDMLSE